MKPYTYIIILNTIQYTILLCHNNLYNKLLYFYITLIMSLCACKFGARLRIIRRRSQPVAISGARARSQSVTLFFVRAHAKVERASHTHRYSCIFARVCYTSSRTLN